MTDETMQEEGFAELPVECAKTEEENGIVVNVDEAFTYIEFGLKVAGQPITCQLDAKEAEALVEALQGAIKSLHEKKSAEVAE